MIRQVSGRPVPFVGLRFFTANWYTIIRLDAELFDCQTDDLRIFKKNLVDRLEHDLYPSETDCPPDPRQSTEWRVGDRCARYYSSTESWAYYQCVRVDINAVLIEDDVEIKYVPKDWPCVRLIEGPSIQRLDYSLYPHRCPACDCSAYIGFKDIECSNKKCHNFYQKVS